MKDFDTQNKYNAERWYAVVDIVLCLFLMGMYLFIAYPSFRRIDIVSLVGLGVCIVCFVVFIIKTDWWPLLVLPHYCFALWMAFFGNVELSALSVLAAAGLALVRGFFREHWMPKVCVGIGVYLAFVISQIRFSIITMFSTLACSIFLCGILVVLVLEMRRSVRDMLPPEIRVPAKAETQSEIFLADYELSQRDLYALYAVLHGQTYPVIGDKLYCSTSTIKQIMRRIYQQFGVSDRSHFVELLSQYKIVPPEWYRVPEEFSSPVQPAAAQTDSAD